MTEAEKLINQIEFVHLHTHTQYSLLDGAARINDLLDRCVEQGMKSIAITDHGSMFGVVEFYKQALARGIKPIIGCEIYTAKRLMTDKEPGKDSEYGHLVLLAKNNNGYKNLMKIVSSGFIDGFYYKPRVDRNLLRKYKDDLIALSACLAGDIPGALLKGQIDTANKLATEYLDIFKEDFYLELMDHGIKEQQQVNRQLIELGKQLGIPMVVTNDIHYVDKSDAQAHDLLLCIQTAKTVEDDNRLKFSSDNFYLKSPEEMQGIFSYIPNALRNTNIIADKCNVSFEFDKLYLPEFIIPSGESSSEYLRKLCNEGLKKRYKVINHEIKDRLEFELGVVESMGYVDYYLIVWDFIRFAKEKEIIVGPGRGSGAGSIIAYLIGITSIDPIKYNLLFERFLNPERISMPDFDIDFCFERRGEVIDYVVEKYGEDRVAQIITFGTMAARAVIRDVGRVLNIPYNQVDSIAKQIPFELGMSIDRALEVNIHLKQSYDENEEIHYLIDMARKLEGLPRHASTHAAGVVISQKPLTEHVPLQRNDESITTQFTMGVLEELGLLKMDFLGLRTLTVIRDALIIIKATKGVEIDIDAIPLNDSEVYKMISQGETDGVFQLESSGMKLFMKDLRPDSFEEIIAGVSLYRPGPMEQIPTYISNKKNPQGIKYQHSLLEPILNVTYGCIVYQEQVMQIVRELAGYSLGRSDLVRRAMSKKKTDVMERERRNFIYGSTDDENGVNIKGAVNNGVDAKVAGDIFNMITEFAKYAFNKSHAAAYAMIAYETGWLKYHYPVEYMAALLTSVMDNINKVALYIQSCKRTGIEVLPPDVNESYAKFTVVGDSIRFGLSAVKNVGVGAIESIINSRKEKGNFISLVDFCEKVNLSCVNKRALESLIKCGAFDSLSINRSQLIAVYEKVVDGVAKNRRDNIEGQVSLFDNVKEEDGRMKQDILPKLEEFPVRMMLSMEKEVIGIYISGHPLDEYKEQLEITCSVTSHDLNNLNEQIIDNVITSNRMDIKDGSMVIVGGIIVNKKIMTTKRNKIMAFITLEDLYGIMEIIVFPTVYERYLNMLEADNMIIVKGKVNLKEEEEPKVLCESISTFKNNNVKKLYIKIIKSKIDVDNNLKPILRKYKGDNPVYLCVINEDGLIKNTLLASRDLWVNVDEGLVFELMELLGKDSVKFV